MRTIGETGFDATLRAIGTFDYKSPLWKIDGLRHLFEPKISYRYSPKAADGAAYIPTIDRDTFTTYMEPFSIADQRNVDEFSRIDTLRISLNNTLQTRSKSYCSRDLATLNFSTDYRFSHNPGIRPLSDLYTEATFSPTPWLQLEACQRYDFHQTEQSELNFSISIMDQKAWNLRFVSHYLRDNYQESLFNYSQRLNEVFDILTKLRYTSFQPTKLRLMPARRSDLDNLL